MKVELINKVSIGRFEKHPFENGILPALSIQSCLTVGAFRLSVCDAFYSYHIFVTIKENHPKIFLYQTKISNSNTIKAVIKEKEEIK
ncbi:MAG: hypothetical protein WHV28_09610 [Bacteroidota bacterium]